jgi:hypothetical protein
MGLLELLADRYWIGDSVLISSVLGFFPGSNNYS